MAGSFLVLGAALVAGFAWYERSHPSARVLALIATLAALAAIGRIAFAPLPNVKPTTDIVLLTGYVLGGAPGFAVGAVAALASNLFFGQGPWTPWQMGAWGLVGIGGAALARTVGRDLGRIGLSLACAAAGAVYGTIMNVSMWVLWSGDHTAAKLGAFFATSAPFDVAHILGNVVFCLAFGPALVRALRRYRSRFEVRWVPSPALARGAAVPAVLAALLLSGAGTPGEAAAAAPERTVRWLAAAQNADGGFGADAGATSTPLHSSWAALGLAAAGRNPRDVRRGSRDALSYLRAHPPRAGADPGDLSRSILAYRAAGVTARDQVGDLVGRRRRDGSFAGRVNTTSFAILALRAARRSTRDPVVRSAGRWLARQANPDGGFNFAGRGGGSGVDDTSSAVQALAAAGRRNTTTVRRAASFIVRRQNPDGGFPLAPGGGSNAQSTSFAIQALVAAGRDPERIRRGGSRDPLAYLRSLIEPSGAVRYSRTSRQTPVWVTSQALLALARKPFPLRAVARARRAPAVGRRAAAPARRTPTPASPTRTGGPAATATPGAGRRSARREPSDASRRARAAAGRIEAADARTLALRARAAGRVLSLLF
jgi:energy-coupling factor transport system substrate-specific component